MALQTIAVLRGVLADLRSSGRGRNFIRRQVETFTDKDAANLFGDSLRASLEPGQRVVVSPFWSQPS